jgi:hypothetical protein
MIKNMIPSPSWILLLASLFLLSCGSTPKSQSQSNSSSTAMQTLTKQQIEEADSLSTPEGSDFKESIVYINEIRKVRVDGELVLWVKGAYPNGCTQLYKASHSLKDQHTLILNLKGWTPTDRICTQALVPYTFIYRKLEPNTLKQLDAYLIDGRRYEF